MPAPANDNVKRGTPKALPKGTTPTAVALAATLGILATWEGKVNDPHWDRYAKIHDVCYGETKVAMRHYSDGECLVMLERRAGQFQLAVLKRNPRLRNSPYQLAAHTSLAYNIGPARYASSSVARLYERGRERDACLAIGLYEKAGGQRVKGLVLRREGDAYRMGEIELCLLPFNGRKPL